MTATAAGAHAETDHQKAGGVAALYLAFALIAAIPYFLVVLDYPGATTAADKVDLIVGHYPSMYAVYLLTYVAFGIAVGALALTRWERLRLDAPTTVRFATAIGLMWAVALVTSGLIFTPPLNDATVAFGLLQIVWFAWLGGALLVTKATARPDHSSTVDDRRVPLTEVAR